MRWVEIASRNGHETFAMDVSLGVIIRSVHTQVGAVVTESMVFVPAAKLEGGKLVPAYDFQGISAETLTQ